ncbi:MAG: flagellar basal-body rod protein FlgF [Pseudomonadota bacterium]
MENPSFVALSQQTALRRQLEVIAHNLANVSTPAFKAERALFAEYVDPRSTSRGVGGPGARASFVKEVAVRRDHRDGALTRTGNSFDFAIHGPGFFALETPDGVRYTRNGRFRPDDQRRLVTSDGHLLLGKGERPIVLPTGEARIEVTRDGAVATPDGELGAIGLVQFGDVSALKRQAGGLYAADAPALPASPKTEIHQGMIEDSNVQPILEITAMIEVTRRYQSAQRMVDTDHERERKAIEKLARVN